MTEQPNDMDRLIDALESRTERMLQLLSSTDELTGQVVALRHDLDTRPTRIEASVKRRRGIVGLLVALVLAMFLVDDHVERCGPGARAERVAQAFANGQTDGQVLRHLAARRAPAVCDVTFPLHTYNGEPWPTGANLVGLALFLTLTAGGAYACRRRTAPQRRHDDVDTTEGAP